MALHRRISEMRKSHCKRRAQTKNWRLKWVIIFPRQADAFTYQQVDIAREYLQIIVMKIATAMTSAEPPNTFNY
jgi:hypothetical protein